MDEVNDVSRLAEFVRRSSQAPSVEALLSGVVADFCELIGVQAALVAGGSPDEPVSIYQAGATLVPVHVSLPEDSGLTALPVPPLWHNAGITSIAAHDLPGENGILVLGWGSVAPDRQDPADAPLVAGAVSVLVDVLAKLVAESALSGLEARVRSAQQLAGMGDYDWHIATDTNRWSDQLYRIYGYEPQSFNASYARFLESIHPDDRERIQAVHQQAYATGEPYEMIERIVRPDGETRYLSSNGEVIMDATGSPIRMRGTCIDVTERVLAEHERERIAERFRGLVEASPEAILVLDVDATVVQANPRAIALLGGPPVGLEVSQFLPDTATGQGVAALGLDGSELTVDVTRVVLSETEPEARIALFLVDATARLEREALAERLGESRARRRQAFEINDNVVQGLAAASYALDQDEFDRARSYLDLTLESARTMMGNLLEPREGALAGGDLVRAASANLVPVPDPDSRTAAAATADEESVPLPRVLIVDDSEDIRMLLRLQLRKVGGLDVVGEAVDGLDAVEQTRSLSPDLVLLDLAMPRMDGLQALPMIRAAAPGVRVIVLSGFSQADLQAEAIGAGADRYLTKGGVIGDLVEVINDVLGAA